VSTVVSKAHIIPPFSHRVQWLVRNAQLVFSFSAEGCTFDFGVADHPTQVPEPYSAAIDYTTLDCTPKPLVAAGFAGGDGDSVGGGGAHLGGDEGWARGSDGNGGEGTATAAAAPVGCLVRAAFERLTREHTAALGHVGLLKDHELSWSELFPIDLKFTKSNNWGPVYWTLPSQVWSSMYYMLTASESQLLLRAECVTPLVLLCRLTALWLNRTPSVAACAQRCVPLNSWCVWLPRSDLTCV
jgi:hypothetical protein